MIASDCTKKYKLITSIIIRKEGACLQRSQVNTLKNIWKKEEDDKKNKK